MLNYASPYYRSKVIEDIQVGMATGRVTTFRLPKGIEIMIRDTMSSRLRKARGVNLHQAIENLADDMINDLRQRLRL